METVIFGSGTLRPEADKASAGLAVVEDEAILAIDLGRNVLSRMVECGIDPLQLEQIALTHLHPDHSAELVSLLFALNYAGSDLRSGPLRIFGPVGLEALVQALGVAWPWLVPKFALQLDEVEPGTVSSVHGFEVRAVRMEHGRTTNFGYRVSSPRSGRSMAFTGDTGPCPGLLVLARDVDLLVAECGAVNDEAPAAHMTPEALARAAEEAGVGHLVVTHLDVSADHERVRAILARGYRGRITMAEDRMRLKVGE
jgi:ribonuclease BN (tRNA processing enzyme)